MATALHDELRSRYEGVLERIERAAAGAGRRPDAVRVVAVTKGVALPVVRAASDAGISRFGESRVQEALPKLAALPDAEWHLVGRLQGNKARRAVRAFAVIHSVDSLALLARLERVAGEEGTSPRLLLEVNVTGETTKAGFPAAWLETPAGAESAAAAVVGARRARVVGLMTIGPAHASVEQSRAAFARLRRLADRLRALTGLPLDELSMGMSADYEAAVAEGATLVRIGTVIFGPRPGTHPPH